MANQRTQYSFVTDWQDRAMPTPPGVVDYAHRALAIWPGLDRHRLRRANNDPLRISRLVASRTHTPIESILVLLHDDA